VEPLRSRRSRVVRPASVRDEAAALSNVILNVANDLHVCGVLHVEEETCYR
jgi:hypothetical protein